MLTGRSVPTSARPEVPQRARTGSMRRGVIVVAAVAVTVALIRAFVLQSFVVPTGSMEPTVHVGDRLAVSRLSYVTGDIRRGDVIVFNGAGVFDPATDGPDTLLGRLGRGVAAAFSVPVDSHDYVKRVIGLPGDHVVCCDAQNRITINGRTIVEPYVATGDEPSSMPFDVVVPADRLWVMGDHRSDSADSRAHLGDPGGGTVPEDRVVGKVVGLYWPLSRIGGLDGGSDR